VQRPSALQLGKYAAVAGAARLFSLSPGTRRAYRVLGNRYEGRKRVRAGLPPRYVERARVLLGLCERHRALRDGDRVLELGTGWVHWEGTTLALFHDVEVVLFDVVDNRLGDAYRRYLSQLGPALNRIGEACPHRLDRARRLLGELQDAASFDEAYRLLGATYALEPSGDLAHFPEGTFSLVVSTDVLEHVARAHLPRTLAETHRTLRPGGHAIHYIDLADHISYFTGAPRKHYLRYSERAWRCLFENDVQHINRVQRPDWLRMVAEAGFEVVQEEVLTEPVERCCVDPHYRALSQQDLECVAIRLVLRKPT
jgi:hypothetical protein